MGLEEKLSPNATYLEVDTWFSSYPAILGVKMWSCILPAGEDWSRVRDRPNPFVWVRGIFVPYLLSSCCVQAKAVILFKPNRNRELGTGNRAGAQFAVPGSKVMILFFN